jgi:uncharacterized membrane protein
VDGGFTVTVNEAVSELPASSVALHSTVVLLLLLLLLPIGNAEPEATVIIIIIITLITLNFCYRYE